METRLDCIVCIVHQALKASRHVTDDIEVQEKVLRRVMEELLEIDWRKNPSDIAYKVHKTVRDITGVNDPYKEVKKESNSRALKLYPRLKEIVENSGDPLETAVKLAIAGNTIDFAAVEKSDVEKTVERVLEKEFAINGYPYLKNKVQTARRLLYFADNAGEIVLDKLLIETMMKVRNRFFEKITFVVKGGPVLNDATPEDAVYVNITSLPNLELKTMSNGDEGSGPERSSLEVRKWFLKHDLVLAKGHDNYAGFSDYENIFLMLIVKCPVVAEDLGVKVGSIVLKYNPLKSPFQRFIR